MSDTGGTFGVNPSWNVPQRPQPNLNPSPRNPQPQVNVPVSVNFPFAINAQRTQIAAPDTVFTVALVRSFEEAINHHLVMMELIGQKEVFIAKIPSFERQIPPLKHFFVSLEKGVKEEKEPLPPEVKQLFVELPKIVQQLASIKPSPESSSTEQLVPKQKPLEEAVMKELFIKMLPTFVRELVKVLPQLPPNLLAVVKEALQEPMVQKFLLPIAEVVKEPILKLPPRRPEPVLTERPPEKEVAPLRFIRQEVVSKVYPNYIPPRVSLPLDVVKMVTENYVELSGKEEEIPSSLLGKAPPMSLFKTPVPPVAFLVAPLPYYPKSEKHVLEKASQFVANPFYMTEIPFAFIVPYVASTPIHTNSSEPPIGKPRPVEDEEYEDADPSETNVLMLSYVAGGGSLYGDPFKEGALDEQPLRLVYLEPFAIGTFLVTNQQFAFFLDGESKKGTIKVDEKGQVVDLQGNTLCQIKALNGQSNLETVSRRTYLGFDPTKGKETYPVTNVTYFGAKAFCVAGGFRLPTEVEWEKAAAVEVDSAGNPVYKYRYGIKQDVIDATLANYQTEGVVDQSFAGHVTPVGFYNGQKMNIKEGRSFQTSNGVSPFGCYDMSGNVAEWTDTADETGDKRIVKGGSFMSSSKEIRVSARQWALSSECNHYTGFRVVLS